MRASAVDDLDRGCGLLTVDGGADDGCAVADRRQNALGADTDDARRIGAETSLARQIDEPAVLETCHNQTLPGVLAAQSHLVRRQQQDRPRGARNAAQEQKDPAKNGTVQHGGLESTGTTVGFAFRQALRQAWILYLIGIRLTSRDAGCACCEPATVIGDQRCVPIERNGSREPSLWPSDFTVAVTPRPNPPNSPQTPYALGARRPAAS